MTVVVDASVAVKWLFDEPGSEIAVGYLLQPLIAPPFFRLECANAVIRRLRLRQINAREARFLVDEVAAMPVELRPVPETAVVDLALLLTHFVYDCAYLALARMEDVPIVTADRRFLEAAIAGGQGHRVRLLGAPHP